MYLFIAIIFIAELIIACTLINFIVKADKKVCRYNACIEAFNPLAQTCLQYSRCLVSTFNRSFDSFFVFIKKKQEPNRVYVTLSLIKMSLTLSDKSIPGYIPDENKYHITNRSSYQ